MHYGIILWSFPHKVQIKWSISGVIRQTDPLETASANSDIFSGTTNEHGHPVLQATCLCGAWYWEKHILGKDTCSDDGDFGLAAAEIACFN